MAKKLVPGDYTATVMSAAYGKNASGKEVYIFEYEITDPKDEGAFVGSRVTQYQNLTNDTSFNILSKTFKTMGLDIANAANPDVTKAKPVRLVLDEEEWPKGSGKKNLRVKWVNAMGPRLDKGSEQETANFLARLHQAARANGEEVAAFTNNATPVATTTGDDDVPF